ncbi:MAG: hypothetical protein WCH34_03260, partial [Bacteroidota bacterium]
MMVKIIQVIAWISGSLVLCFVAFLVWASLSNLNSDLCTPVEIKGNDHQTYADSGIINLISWNIGYCGLGKEMDFFYDGGTKTRCSIEQYQSYLNGVFNILASLKNIDFCLLQEVDLDSKRSYYT